MLNVHRAIVIKSVGQKLLEGWAAGDRYFGFGFGAETDLKCNFGSVSVPTLNFTFGFGRNYTADDRNWPKLE